MKNCFSNKLLPSPITGGFRMDNYWIWCGSVIRGEDGKYHMFASRVPKDLDFTFHWLTNSEIVRAVSDTPEGPYTFAEVVLPPKDGDHWDGRMTHNPTIHRYKDIYLLFYIGTTFSGSTQTRDPQSVWVEARSNQRIGMATSSSIFGPWTRRDPILLPRYGKWDAFMTTNPAPWVEEDGSVLLIYKSTANNSDLLRLGVARADHYEGPYVRLSDEPIFHFDETGDHIEDAYIWRDRETDAYQLLMKDVNGGISGERGAGVHAASLDGVRWTISNPPLAYSRSITWDNGDTIVQGALERPQLLIEGGIPTHFFAATSDGPGGYNNASNTWNMVIPLKICNSEGER